MDLTLIQKVMSNILTRPLTLEPHHLVGPRARMRISTLHNVKPKTKIGAPLF